MEKTLDSALLNLDTLCDFEHCKYFTYLLDIYIYWNLWRLLMSTHVILDMGMLLSQYFIRKCFDSFALFKMLLAFFISNRDVINK